MEGLVLQSLDFRVNAPTCFTFYSVLLRHLQPSDKTAALASYILVYTPLIINRACFLPADDHPGHCVLLAAL